MDYELNYTQDDKQQSRIIMSSVAFQQMKRSAAVSKSDLSWQKSTAGIKNKPAAVGVNKGGYAIAKTSNMKEYDQALRADTLAEAKAKYNALVTENPELKSEIQIVAHFELADA